MEEMCFLRFTGDLYALDKKDNEIRHMVLPEGEVHKFVSGNTALELAAGGEGKVVAVRLAKALVKVNSENYERLRKSGGLKDGCKPPLVIEPVSYRAHSARVESPLLPTAEEWKSLKFQQKKEKLATIAKSYNGLDAKFLAKNPKEDELDEVYLRFAGMIVTGGAKFIPGVFNREG